MPDASPLEPIVLLTDAPTAEEDQAILGTVSCLPPGTRRIFMTKPLV